MRALRFDNRFVRELPADPEPDNHVRPVHGACYSRVMPTPVKAPRVLAWSREVAEILGVDDKVGSLEVGKDGDFSLWSGSPFDSQSRCLQTWIEGRSLFEVQAYREQQKRLRSQRQAWLEQALKQEAKP